MFYFVGLFLIVAVYIVVLAGGRVWVAELKEKYPAAFRDFGRRSYGPTISELLKKEGASETEQKIAYIAVPLCTSTPPLASGMETPPLYLMLVVSILFWPVALFVATIVATGYGIYKGIEYCTRPTTTKRLVALFKDKEKA